MDEKPKLGRPTKYSEELAENICDAIASTVLSLPNLCNSRDDFPTAETIRTWRWKYKTFSAKYAMAKQHQAEILAETIHDLSKVALTYIDGEGNARIDAGSVASTRLQVDSLKWEASKLVPKIYGDARRVEELEGENERVKAELKELRDKLNKANVSEY